MRFLIIGRGGREHALVRALKFSASVNEIHVAPGSPGISRDAICHALDLTDRRAVESFVTKYRFDCVIVGSEAYALDGLCDHLRALDVPTVGAGRATAQRLRDHAAEMAADAGVAYAPSAAGEQLSAVVLVGGAHAECLPLVHVEVGPGDWMVTAPAATEANLRDQILSSIVEPIVRSILGQDPDYRGAVAVDLRLTEDGPSVRDVSASFGETPAQVTLPLFAGDWGRTFANLARGELSALNWTSGHVACVVKTSVEAINATNAAIEGDLGYQTHSSYFLHAGTAKSTAGQWIVAGHHVLNAIGIGGSADEARRASLAQASGVSWRGGVRPRNSAESSPDL